jgi:hypothetical protein
VTANHRGRSAQQPAAQRGQRSARLTPERSGGQRIDRQDRPLSLTDPELAPPGQTVAKLL